MVTKKPIKKKKEIKKKKVKNPYISKVEKMIKEETDISGFN